MGIQLKWAFALCLAVCAAQTGSADDRPLYKNPMAPVSARHRVSVWHPQEV
jgi:hypothetical protein